MVSGPIVCSHEFIFWSVKRPFGGIENEWSVGDRQNVLQKPVWRFSSFGSIEPSREGADHWYGEGIQLNKDGIYDITFVVSLRAENVVRQVNWLDCVILRRWYRSCALLSRRTCASVMGRVPF